MSNRKGCPRCEKRGMKTWSELTEEEREVVKRIPRTGDHTDEERRAHHRWCTRCWFEQVPPDQTQA